jgi:dephospho-CoA kinase
MLRAALTGGIGTGKSYVASRLRAAGVPVVDADVVAREVVAPGKAAMTAIVRRFGETVLSSDGGLDRARLGDIVFRDEAARRDLEAIVHPTVRAEIERFFASLPADTPLGIADIPLLYETGRDADFDVVIVAACSRETQLARVMKRDGLSRDAAERRLAAQWPTERKAQRADFVIRTDGSHAETDAQVDAVLSQLGAAPERR